MEHCDFHEEVRKIYSKESDHVDTFGFSRGESERFRKAIAKMAGKNFMAIPGERGTEIWAKRRGEAQGSCDQTQAIA